MKRILLLSGLLLLAIPTFDAAARSPHGEDPDPAAGALVDAMVAAHGGAERLRAIEGMRMEGVMRTPDGTEGTFIRVSRGPGALASLTDMPGRTEIRVLAQGRGWRGASHEALQPVSGALLSAMQMQSARLLAPVILHLYRDRVALVAGDVDGPTLELALAEGAVLRARLDPETNLLEWTRSVIHIGETPLTFTTRYSDFRTVDGLILAHREENTAQGVPTASLVLERLVLNPVGTDLLLVPAGALGGSPDAGPVH